MIVCTDLHSAKISTRNIMCGTVDKIIEGPVSAEVDIEIGGGNTISAVITEVSAKTLAFRKAFMPVPFLKHQA